MIPKKQLKQHYDADLRLWDYAHKVLRDEVCLTYQIFYLHYEPFRDAIKEYIYFSLTETVKERIFF